MVISKKGKSALDSLCKSQPSLAKYKQFIAASLSVRILQKCKYYYKNIKISKLQKLLNFFDNTTEIERLLYKCNRDGLIYTTLNYHSNGEGFLSFNPEAEVTENLFEFGNQLRTVFKAVEEATSENKDYRKRIFGKVKEKLEEESEDIRAQRDEMKKIQDAINHGKNEAKKRL